MASLVVRDIDDDVVKALKARAGMHGVSAEAEHRKILESVLVQPKKKRFAEVLLSIPNALVLPPTLFGPLAVQVSAVVSSEPEFLLRVKFSLLGRFLANSRSKLKIFLGISFVTGSLNIINSCKNLAFESSFVPILEGISFLFEISPPVDLCGGTKRKYPNAVFSSRIAKYLFILNFS